MRKELGPFDETRQLQCVPRMSWIAMLLPVEVFPFLRQCITPIAPDIAAAEKVRCAISNGGTARSNLPFQPRTVKQGLEHNARLAVKI